MRHWIYGGGRNLKEFVIKIKKKINKHVKISSDYEFFDPELIIQNAMCRRTLLLNVFNEFFIKNFQR